MREHVLDHRSVPTAATGKTHASVVLRELRYLAECVVILSTLPFLLPMMAGFALAIKASSPGPVLLRLRTLGKDGRVFQQYRFRTMQCGAPQAVWGREVTLQDRQITRIGRFLLESGLNVLPQLLNVLRRDMVLIGPPPLALAQVGMLKGNGHRLRCKPGIISRPQPE